MTRRASFYWRFFGRPVGRLGRVGTRLMVRINRNNYARMAAALGLRPDDDLLDVGCGSAMLLAEHAKRARHVAGLDASDLQLDVARQRLADHLAAGTAELVKGDAAALPWADGRFSVVTSMFCLKFVPDPLKALEEMFRVLRPGGRAVVALCDQLRDEKASGTVNAWGQWGWNASDARLLMEKAGFAEVTSSVIGSPASQLVQGVRVV
ncbi:2-methoxy-6-polyprenyl-1,4-benzoquinol methylase, mitochondrial [Cellulomonas sp. T2.31MG-18]